MFQLPVVESCELDFTAESAVPDPMTFLAGTRVFGPLFRVQNSSAVYVTSYAIAQLILGESSHFVRPPPDAGDSRASALAAWLVYRSDVLHGPIARSLSAFLGSRLTGPRWARFEAFAKELAVNAASTPELDVRPSIAQPINLSFAVELF